MDGQVLTRRGRFMQKTFSDRLGVQNVSLLCEAADAGPQLTKLKSAVLWRASDEQFPVGGGSRTQTVRLLIEVLLDGVDELVVDDSLFDQVCAFCQPFPDNKKYQEVNFIRGGPFRITEPAYTY